MSFIQFNVSKSINKVLLAFVTSVTCSPVSLKSNQLSIVPKDRSLSSRACFTSSTFLNNHKILDNEKYVAIGNPVLLNDSSNSVNSLSSSQMFCVLVSCQTNALCNGSAVDFLQANVVSL